MAIRFDEASDRVTYSASVPPDDFTITAWVSPSVDTDTWATFLRVWSAGENTVGTWSTDSDGLTGPCWFTGAGSIVQSTNFTVGDWRMVAVSRTAAGAAVAYAAVPDGLTEVDSGAVSAAVPAGITLGGRAPTDFNEPLNGRLAHVRVWDGILTQAQIEAEWLSESPVVTAGLWADWRLESDLNDYSGNTRNLTAGTTPTSVEDGPPIVTGLPSGRLLIAY